MSPALWKQSVMISYKLWQDKNVHLCKVPLSSQILRILNGQMNRRILGTYHCSSVQFDIFSFNPTWLGQPKKWPCLQLGLTGIQRKEFYKNFVLLHVHAKLRIERALWHVYCMYSYPLPLSHSPLTEGTIFPCFPSFFLPPQNKV